MVVKIIPEFLSIIDKHTKLIRYPNVSNKIKHSFDPSSQQEVGIFEVESSTTFGIMSSSITPTCMLHLASTTNSSTGRTRLNIKKEELLNGFWWYDNEVIGNRTEGMSLIDKQEIKDIVRYINSDTSDTFMLNSVGKISSALIQSVNNYNERVGAIDENHYLINALKELEKFNKELCTSLDVVHNSKLFTPRYKITNKYIDKGEVTLTCHNNEGYTSDFTIGVHYIADVYSSNDKLYYNVRGVNFTPDRVLEFFKPYKKTVELSKN